MRISITALALMLGASTAQPAPARTMRAAELRLVFLDADERSPVRQGLTGAAAIDVGRIIAGRCRGSGCMRTIVKRRVRLRVDGTGATRFVQLRAFIHELGGGQRVRLDGRVLTSAPQVIDAAMPLHVAVTHTLEIEVPASEPAGVLAQDIVWLVEDVR